MLSRPYSFKFFKGFLSQILFGPFLNTLSNVTCLPQGLLFDALDRSLGFHSVKILEFLVYVFNDAFTSCAESDYFYNHSN